MRDNNQKIEAAGIKDGDMIAMVLRNNQAHPQQNSQGFQDRRAPTAEAQRIEGIRQRLVQSPQAMAQLRAQQPAMASVVHDPERFRAVWQEMEDHDRQLEGERRDEIDLLNGDFMNVDNQKKIEEMIRQQQVMENLQFAYTHSPEGEQHHFDHFSPMLTTSSLCTSHHAVHSRHREQLPCQSLCGFWRSNHHHVALVRRSLQHHATHRPTIFWYRERCWHSSDPWPSPRCRHHHWYFHNVLLFHSHGGQGR
jgi:flagellar biosynthesis/type III secretory pathway chaperone